MNTNERKRQFPEETGTTWYVQKSRKFHCLIVPIDWEIDPQGFASGRYWDGRYH